MELEFCEHYRQVGPMDEWSCTAECVDSVDVKEAYNSGNSVGIVEGLEMAALYHDNLANSLSEGAIWAENGNPINGQAMAVDRYRRDASNIRAMKPIQPQASLGGG